MINAIIPAYGSDRAVASPIAEHLDHCEWVGIPFAMGCGIVQHLKARTINANDLHRHAMNLCQIVGHQNTWGPLVEELRTRPFHPDVLARAQQNLRGQRCEPGALSPGAIRWAADYFTAAWMARNGEAGKTKEFEAGQSIRWNAGGGDSVRRFRNAVDALEHWHRQLVDRVTFTTLDFREFLRKCHDKPNHGLYCDPPWPEDGKPYKHGFSDDDHVMLAARLSKFDAATVVVRTNDHELNRELYAGESWVWHKNPSRNSKNNPVNEVLIVRNGREA